MSLKISRILTDEEFATIRAEMAKPRRIMVLESEPAAHTGVYWMPIATAPKDGTEILVCVAGLRGGCMQVVSWDDDSGAPEHHWGTADGITYSDTLFTHWQHLPPLPTPPEDPAP